MGAVPPKFNVTVETGCAYPTAWTECEKKTLRTVKARTASATTTTTTTNTARRTPSPRHRRSGRREGGHDAGEGRPYGRAGLGHHRLTAGFGAVDDETYGFES